MSEPTSSLISTPPFPSHLPFPSSRRGCRLPVENLWGLTSTRKGGALPSYPACPACSGGNGKGIRLRLTVPGRGKDKGRRGDPIAPICLVPLGLAGKPQRKEMVKVASQLAGVPVSGLGIGGGRHTPLSQEPPPGTSALCHLQTVFRSPQIRCVPFSRACSASVALSPSEFAFNSYLI